MTKGCFVLFVTLVLVAAFAQDLEAPSQPATILANKPCFEKGEAIRASFENVEGEGVWIGLYPKKNVDDLRNLPSLSEGKLSEWILTCGQRSDCHEGWPSKGVIRFDTENLEYGEYVIAVSGDRAITTSQAYSETFIVDAHCPELHHWVPAGKNDQRSPCPFVNTVANHGFINRNGTFIDVEDMARKLEAVYNVATEFLLQGPIQQMIDCNQTYFDANGMRRFDLNILFDDNCEEHEASMVRVDNFFGFEKSRKVDDQLLNNLMRRNRGNSFLTLEDIFHYQADRIMESRLTNPETEFRHFDIGNMGAQGMFLFLLSSDKTLTTVEKKRLYFFLLDEKLPEDFEPGSLRDTPFNPRDPADFMSQRLEISMNNIESMMHLPIAEALKSNHRDADIDHGDGI